MKNMTANPRLFDQTLRGRDTTRLVLIFTLTLATFVWAPSASGQDVVAAGEVVVTLDEAIQIAL
ncbi:MAG: hypothetical protein O7C39_04190, partial [Bacteroidetes bacterium]|nr:hypothetical protein [Bacteroidota bacterium]